MMAVLGASGISSALPSRVSPTGVHSVVMLLTEGWGRVMMGQGAEAWTSPSPGSVPPGLFASVSKISKAVDAPPSSVTSTPRTPRMDFSRVTGKGRREHKGQAEPMG